MVKYYDEEDYLDVDSHMPYLKDNLIDKEVAEKLSKEVSSNIIEQVKNNMDNSIEERARLAAYQIYEEIGLSKHSVDRVSEIIAEKIIEQKAIEIEKACNVFCHTGCPHKTDSYNCLNAKCDTWKIFRRMMEE